MYMHIHLQVYETLPPGKTQLHLINIFSYYIMSLHYIQITQVIILRSFSWAASKKKVAKPSETQKYIYQATRRLVPEDLNLYPDLKSRRFTTLFSLL
jgi:hypothetical protein